MAGAGSTRSWAVRKLTDARREHMAELAALPDETINTSDLIRQSTRRLFRAKAPRTWEAATAVA